MRLARLIASIVLLVFPLLVRAQSPDDRALTALTKSMESAPPDQRLAFNALFVAFTTFRDAHLRHETCRTAEGCVQQSAERDRLDEEFVKMGYGFAPAQAPSFSSTALAAADETLNDYFKKITAALPESCSAPNCTSRGTEREVQRDWIRYRDAWTTFGTMRWPSISSETWRTYLTAQRGVQLLFSFNAILCCS